MIGIHSCASPSTTAAWTTSIRYARPPSVPSIVRLGSVSTEGRDIATSTVCV